MARKLTTVWELIKATFSDWIDDKAPRLGAALAYYTLFSLAPILIIAIAIAGFVFGEEAARGQIVGQIQGLVGVDGGRAIEAMLASVSKPSSGILATIIGLLTLLIGATGAFVELQDALNTVWEVKLKPGSGVKELIRERVLSFGMILGIGFLLLVSLVLSAGLAALSKFIGDAFPGSVLLGQLLNIALSLAMTTLLFAMIYKILPDVKLAWSDVWVGAAVTSVLFTLGKFLIGLYLGRGSVASAYGAAGSLVALIVWLYYSTQILLLGAEFTQVYAESFGRHIEPTEKATYTAEHYERLAAKKAANAAKAGGHASAHPAPGEERRDNESKLRITPLPSDQQISDS